MSLVCKWFAVGAAPGGVFLCCTRLGGSPKQGKPRGRERRVTLRDRREAVREGQERREERDTEEKEEREEDTARERRIEEGDGEEGGCGGGHGRAAGGRGAHSGAAALHPRRGRHGLKS